MVVIQNAKIKKILPPLISVLLLIGAWDVLVRHLEIRPQILPSPSLVLSTLRQYYRPLLNHTGVTLMRTSIAFFIGVAVGTILALAFALSPLAEKITQPLLTTFYCLPKSVIVPIFLLWTGLGTAPAILTGVSLSFFPVFINVLAGLKSIPPELAELCVVSGGSKLHILRKIGLPNTFPFLFGAFRTSGPGALVGVLIAEMMAASNGLGYVIVLSGSIFNVPLLFSTLVILALVGIIIYGTSSIIEKRFAHWAFRH